MKHVNAGVVAAFVTVALAGAQPPTTVSGRVVSDASGDPVPNARIAVTPAVPGGSGGEAPLIAV